MASPKHSEPGSGPGADVLDRFSPATAEWFRGSFSAPTAAQAGAWEAISSGHHALVVAPTGSGKTLSAFLWALDRLASEPVPGGEAQALPGPLRLAHEGPRGRRRAQPALARWSASGTRRRGWACPRPTSPWPCARVTPLPSERRAFARTPSDVLITTPESLFLILTSQAREALAGVETVILDEVHAVAGTKRGAHLALTLERLDALLEQAGAAHRAVRHRRAGRGGGPLPRRRPTGRGRAAALDQGVGPRRRRAHRRTCPRSARSSRRPVGVRGRRGAARLDLAARRGAHRRPRRRAPLDAGVRQLAAPRRAAHRPAQRDLGGAPRRGRGPRRGPDAARRDDGAARGDGAAPATPRGIPARALPPRSWRSRASSGRPRRAGPGPPRLGQQGAPPAHRGGPQGRAAARGRRDELARARHRHGRGRPRRPGRVAAVRWPAGCSGSAAPVTRSARCPGACCSRSSAATSCRRPWSSSGCAPGPSSPCACRPTPSTSSPSRSWPCAPSTSGPSTTSSSWSAGPPRSPPCRARSSSRCSTCSPGATPATSSPSSARASSGTA